MPGLISFAGLTTKSPTVTLLFFKWRCCVINNIFIVVVNRLFMYRYIFEKFVLNKCSDYFLAYSDVIFTFQQNASLQVCLRHRNGISSCFFSFSIWYNMNFTCFLISSFFCFIMLTNTISLFLWKYFSIIKAIFYYVFKDRKL